MWPSRKPTQTLLSLQAYWHALLKTWPKHEPLDQGTKNAKGVQLRTKTKVYAKVDKLPPSFFM